MTAPGPPRLVDRGDPGFPQALVALAELVDRVGLPAAGLADVGTVVLLGGSDGAAAVAGLEARGAGHSRVLLLRSVVVAPELQGRGLGGCVVRAALERADGLGLPVALLTDTAADWYLRLGFRPVQREALPPALGASAELRGACPATATAMLRPAGPAVSPPGPAPRAVGPAAPR